MNKMTNKMFNLYIDESCHLEHDGIQIMCIGYTKIEYEKYPIIKDDIKKILKYRPHLHIPLLFLRRGVY